MLGEIIWSRDGASLPPHLEVIGPDPDPLAGADVRDGAACRTGTDRALGAPKPLSNLLDGEPFVVTQLGRRTLTLRVDAVVAQPARPLGLQPLLSQPDDLLEVESADAGTSTAGGGQRTVGDELGDTGRGAAEEGSGLGVGDALDWLRLLAGHGRWGLPSVGETHLPPARTEADACRQGHAQGA